MLLAYSVLGGNVGGGAWNRSTEPWNGEQGAGS